MISINFGPSSRTQASTASRRTNSRASRRSLSRRRLQTHPPTGRARRATTRSIARRLWNLARWSGTRARLGTVARVRGKELHAVRDRRSVDAGRRAVEVDERLSVGRVHVSLRQLGVAKGRRLGLGARPDVRAGVGRVEARRTRRRARGLGPDAPPRAADRREAAHPLAFHFVPTRHLFSRDLERHLVCDATLGRDLLARTQAFSQPGSRASHAPSSPTLHDARIRAVRVVRTNDATTAPPNAPKPAVNRASGYRCRLVTHAPQTWRCAWE